MFKVKEFLTLVLLNKLNLVLIFSQLGISIQTVYINSYKKNGKQCRFLLQKPTDLDLHCLQIRVYLGSAGQGLSIDNVLDGGWVLVVNRLIQEEKLDK